MLAGEFARRLKKLNPKLEVFFGSNPRLNATLYYKVWDTDRFDYITICAVDKSYVPENTVIDETNHIVKGGWRRVINILLSRKLVDRSKAERLFDTKFRSFRNLPLNPVNDPITRAIRDAEARGRGRIDANGNEATHLRTDDLVDIARMIRKDKEKKGIEV
jgi:hypothetical protein